MIYGIENSEQAEEFGKAATPNQIKALKKAASVYQAQYKLTKNCASCSILEDGLFNRLMIIATHKQLCDEAIYSYQVRRK